MLLILGLLVTLAVFLAFRAALPEVRAQGGGIRPFTIHESAPAPEPGLSMEDPVLTCGSIWEGGREVGASSCLRPADLFWAAGDELYCRCSRCGGRDWKVPNGRSVDRDEAEAIVAAQQVMLS